MKHKIRATYNNSTFEFTIVDNTWWMRWWKRFVGITLSGNKVYFKNSFSYTTSLSKYIIGHEAIHVYQARKLRWKFIPVYLWYWMKVGFNYRENIMEQEAYKNQYFVEWYYL